MAISVFLKDIYADYEFLTDNFPIEDRLICTFCNKGLTSVLIE